MKKIIIVVTVVFGLATSTLTMAATFAETFLSSVFETQKKNYLDSGKCEDSKSQPDEEKGHIKWMGVCMISGNKYLILLDGSTPDPKTAIIRRDMLIGTPRADGKFEIVPNDVAIEFANGQLMDEYKRPSSGEMDCKITSDVGKVQGKLAFQRTCRITSDGWLHEGYMASLAKGGAAVNVTMYQYTNPPK